MNARITLKRFALGAFVLGLSGTIAFSAHGRLAQASAFDPAAPETRQESEGTKHSPEGKHPHKRFFLFEDAASIIGIDQTELKKQLEGGQSLAQIAKAKGIAEEDLINRLLAIRLQKIDEAVKSGQLPQERADHIKEKLPAHLKMLVNKTDWKEWRKEHGAKEEEKGEKGKAGEKNMKDKKDKKDKEGKEHHSKKAKETQADNEELPF
ncbi:hypothetical protein ACFFNY_00570 [Paenibacillus hodogayensis]|uniref:Uncharacterized protein n=1 Tax=Paenibacillus hodogayensis TaxID=279208 RepID=A0ABV5VP97_9BACL